MPTLEQDLAYLQSTVPDLESYLLSSVLFWPLSARGKQKALIGATQLTIGNLLLSQKRLETAAAAGLQPSTELETLFSEIEAIRNRWRSNWDQKAAREIASRLKAWGHYCSELSTEEGKRGDYPYNVRQRVMLGLLFADLGRPMPRDQAQLELLDRRLKSATRPAEFVWEAALKSGFPPGEFWYLYREPA
jgi:hypothetical protein